MLRVSATVAAVPALLLSKLVRERKGELVLVSCIRDLDTFAVEVCFMLGNGKGVYIGNANHDDELNMMQFGRKFKHQVDSSKFNSSSP